LGAGAIAARLRRQMKQRIQKVLAAAGVESRRHIEAMVLEGRVAVNGKVVTRLPVMVDPLADSVSIDGETIRIRPSGRSDELVYLLMNKPKDVYCTNVAQGEQVRAIDLLGEDYPHRVYPVGRLDADSKGLLLLTNDGELANKLTHPRYEIAKTYVAVVAGRVSDETIEAMREGVWLADPKRGGFKTRPSRVRIAKKLPAQTVLEVTLREGRNRQVRRVLAKLGHKVRELIRVKMGPLELGNLNPGSYRPLTSKELRELKIAIEHAEKKASERAAEKKASAPQRPVKKKAKPSASRPKPGAGKPKRTIIADDEVGEY
jgi:pseudouridine synthase